MPTGVQELRQEIIELREALQRAEDRERTERQRANLL
jgi:hypothetical protein